MSDPLWERVLVAATGPVLTAALALIVLNQVTAAAQRRRDTSEMRERLAAELTEVANGLYFALQRYWRTARDMDIPLKERKGHPKLTDIKLKLDATYESARIRGQTIERRLLIYYKSDEPAQALHKVFDLLTVRYFLLTESDRNLRMSVRKRNSGSSHSGLTGDELNDPKKLLSTIRDSIANAAEILWLYPLDRQGKHIRADSRRPTWRNDDAWYD